MESDGGLDPLLLARRAAILDKYEGLKTTYQGWAGMTFGHSGTGTGMDNSIPETREWEGNGKNTFPKFGNGRGMKKSHSQNSGMGREWKNWFPKFGNGKGMKKSIPIIWEWESEAYILGNGREREFPLTPATYPELPLNPCYYQVSCSHFACVRRSYFTLKIFTF